MFIVIYDSTKPAKKLLMDKIQEGFAPNVYVDNRKFDISSVDKKQDIVVLMGFSNINANIIRMCMEDHIDFYYIDNSYTDVHRKKMYSLSFNSLQSTYRREGVTEPAPSRYVEEEVSSAAGKVIVVPPSYGLQRLLNIGSWTTDLVTELVSKSGEGIEILISTKPGPLTDDVRDSIRLPRVKHIGMAKEHIRRAICVCAYNSRIVVNAHMCGVPIYCDNTCIASIVSQNRVDILNPRPVCLADNDRLVAMLDTSQFNVESFRKGIALRCLNKK